LIMWFRIGLSVAMLLAITTGLTTAQQMIVYPAKGQTPAQQDKDKYECSSWATQQTGFNPTMPPPLPQQSAPPPGVFGTAARGAAVGAVGGAIGGNAGKGAAIGAGVGAVFGGMRQNRYAREQQYASDQATVAYSNQLAAYNRAMAACLTGRGYSVS
jgi:YMGG-like Gly-zipper